MRRRYILSIPFTKLPERASDLVIFFITYGLSYDTLILQTLVFRLSLYMIHLTLLRLKQWIMLTYTILHFSCFLL